MLDEPRMIIFFILLKISLVGADRAIHSVLSIWKGSVSGVERLNVDDGEERPPMGGLVGIVGGVNRPVEVLSWVEDNGLSNDSCSMSEEMMS